MSYGTFPSPCLFPTATLVLGSFQHYSLKLQAHGETTELCPNPICLLFLGTTSPHNLQGLPHIQELCRL